MPRLLLFEIGIACLSVFGFYCLLKTLMEWLFSSERLWIAVEVREEKDADMLDMLLHEADSAFFRRRGMKTVVMISSDLFDREIVGTADGVLYDQYAALLDEYAAECYIMDWN